MQHTIKKIFFSIIKWGFRAYVIIAALIGTAVMVYPFILVLYNGLYAPAPMPVYLPNGFIYDNDWDAPVSSHIITNKKGNVAVVPDVRDVMWDKNTIYGYRKGPAGEPYYYICTYGEDCSKTQHFTDVAFLQALKERGLPEYVPSKAKTYEVLLWEQARSRKDYGYGG